MTQFKTEGQRVFPENNENDNSSDSSSEETNINQTGSSDQNKDSDESKNGDDKSTNFADHPRWKEREDDWKNRFNDQEKRHSEELAKLREELSSKLDGLNKSKPNENAEVPPWFGGDETQWQEFQKWNESLVSKAKSEALKEFETKSTSEQKAIDEATNYFQEEIAKLESDKTLNPNGEKVDKNKLLKFVLDNDLVDSKGRWNYRAGYQIMKSVSSQSKNNAVDEKKKLAGATTSDNKAEQKSAPFATSADFSKPSNRPW